MHHGTWPWMAHPDVSWCQLGPWHLETWYNGNVFSHCKVHIGNGMSAQFFRSFHQWMWICCLHNGNAHYNALSHEHSTITPQYGVVLIPEKDFLAAAAVNLACHLVDNSWFNCLAMHKFLCYTVQWMQARHFEQEDVKCLDSVDMGTIINGDVAWKV